MRFSRTTLTILIVVMTASIGLVFVLVVILVPDTHANLGDVDPNFDRVTTGEIDTEQPLRPSFDPANALADAERDGALTVEERGRILYFANSCATCHGIGGGGATVGPDPIDSGNFEDFLEAMREGDDGMPLYAEEVISDAQADEIFAFLEGLHTDSTARVVDQTKE
jgi:hypothetical protein